VFVIREPGFRGTLGNNEDRHMFEGYAGCPDFAVLTGLPTASETQVCGFMKVRRDIPNRHPPEIARAPPFTIKDHLVDSRKAQRKGGASHLTMRQGNVCCFPSASRPSQEIPRNRDSSSCGVQRLRRGPSIRSFLLRG
jgi:hypothetical protein